MDAKQWEALKVKPPKSMEEFTNKDAQVNVQLSQNSLVFCNKMEQWLDCSQELYQEAIDLSNEINQQCCQLTKSLQRLSECFKNISKVNQMVKLQQSTDLFASLSKIISGTGTYLSNTGELTKLYCGSHLKYHRAETDSIREVFSVRQSLHREYLKRERALFIKKDKLFQAKNPSKWQFTQGSLEELVGRSDELFKDKMKAFKFMLSQETQQLHELHEELSFYTNQCLDEVRRLG